MACQTAPRSHFAPVDLESRPRSELATVVCFTGIAEPEKHSCSIVPIEYRSEDGAVLRSSCDEDGSAVTRHSTVKQGNDPVRWMRAWINRVDGRSAHAFAFPLLVEPKRHTIEVGVDVQGDYETNSWLGASRSWFIEGSRLAEFIASPGQVYRIYVRAQDHGENMTLTAIVEPVTSP